MHATSTTESDRGAVEASLALERAEDADIRYEEALTFARLLAPRLLGMTTIVALLVLGMGVLPKTALAVQVVLDVALGLACWQQCHLAQRVQRAAAAQTAAVHGLGSSNRYPTQGSVSTYTG